MPTTATIVLDQRQADGTRRVRCIYRHDTGETRDVWPIYVPNGSSAQKHCNGLIAREEIKMRRGEIRTLVEAVFAGKHTIAETNPRLTTKPKLREVFFGTLFNEMLEANPDKEILEGGRAELEITPNPVIAGVLRGWSASDVQAARVALSGRAATSLNHGKGEYGVLEVFE